MTQATRDRKVQFMDSFGSRAMRAGVEECFAKFGVDWLTDEQIDDIVRDRIATYRFTQRLNRENRARAAGRAA